MKFIATRTVSTTTKGRTTRIEKGERCSAAKRAKFSKAMQQHIIALATAPKELTGETPWVEAEVQFIVSSYLRNFNPATGEGAQVIRAEFREAFSTHQGEANFIISQLRHIDRANTKNNGFEHITHLVRSIAHAAAPERFAAS